MTESRKTSYRFALPHTIEEDRKRLAEVDIPILTISATFRKDIAQYFGEKAKNMDDVVFSRAHFSMAIAALEQSYKRGISAWLVDPTNYVSPKEWRRVQITEFVGQIAARVPIVKKLKDIMDTAIRSQLPIRKAVTPPLVYVSADIQKPILSFHYEVGNVLAKEGKTVVQVVTDPHVRVHYVLEGERPNIYFAVFDENTKKELIQKAKTIGKRIPEERVIVTGPPVDPRIVAKRKNKTKDDYKKRPLRLAVTTGGLGTNKGEIHSILGSISEEIKKGEIQVLLYASTHSDFKKMFDDFTKKYNLPQGKLEDQDAPVRVIYEESIIDANQKLIDFAFSWADGFVTKPSGDMAYDAVAAGCFVLSLSPWGEWEEKIYEIFEKKGVLKKVDRRHFNQQVKGLLENNWIEEAIERALKIDHLFLNGIDGIVKLQQRLKK